MNAVINLVSGKNVTQIWPSPTGKQQIGSVEQPGYVTNVDEVPVMPGDMIRFEVRATGDNPFNAVSWTPSVGYIEARPGRLDEASSSVAPNPASAPAAQNPAPIPTKVRYDVTRDSRSQSMR